MGFDFNKVIDDNNDEDQALSDIVTHSAIECAIKNNDIPIEDSVVDFFRRLPQEENDFLIRLLKISGILSANQIVTLKDYYDKFPTELAFDLIKMTADVSYLSRKGYLSVQEESRCYTGEIHKIFLKYKNNHPFEFTDCGVYSIFRPYAHVSIVILMKQIDNTENIPIPIEIKEDYIILFDTQTFTSIDGHRIPVPELPRFLGIYKKKKDDSYELKEREVRLPFDLLENFTSR